MDLFDIEISERVEADLDRLISKRSARLKEEAEQERVEAAWAETTRRYNEKRHRENAAWREYHVRAADNLERTAAQLAAEHRAKAAELATGQGPTLHA